MPGKKPSPTDRRIHMCSVFFSLGEKNFFQYHKNSGNVYMRIEKDGRGGDEQQIYNKFCFSTHTHTYTTHTHTMHMFKSGKNRLGHYADDLWLREISLWWRRRRPTKRYISSKGKLARVRKMNIIYTHMFLLYICIFGQWRILYWIISIIFYVYFNLP